MLLVEMLLSRSNFVLLLVEHRVLSGAAGASEVSVTEAPAVYCHRADGLYVCIKPRVIVSDRRADAVTISKERPENQPTQTVGNHIYSVQGTTNTSSHSCK